MNPKSARQRRVYRIAQDNRAPTPTPTNDRKIHPPKTPLPDPWLYDTNALIRDLDYIRELVLRIPVHLDTALPSQTTLDAIWSLRERLWELVGIHRELQRDWAKRGFGVKAPVAAKSNVPARKIAVRGAA